MRHSTSERDTSARWPRRAKILAAATVFGLGLNACSVKEERHGHKLPTDVVAALQKPNVTQAQVVQLIGTPTTESAFDRGTWYYISEVQQSYAFFRPDVVERQVLILRFDEARQLETISTLSKEDGQEVTLVARETPTEGHKLSLFEQLVGNLGRFNSPGR